MAEIAVRKTKFVDFDLNFSIHPISNDIGKRVDVNAISTAMRNLIMTNKYDRPFHPEIASQVSELLFENFTPATMENLKKAILYVIENFEPRVTINDIILTEFPDDNHLLVELKYQIIGTTETIKTKFTLERTL